MTDRALVELTLRYGAFGSQSKTVAIPIDEWLTRELLTTVERSDEPFSLMVASPSMWGGKENAVTIRERVFKMRRDVAQHIAKLMAPALMEAFGVKDELDGYKIEGMKPDEREFHRMRGKRI